MRSRHVIMSERMVAAREPQAASVAQETAAAEADAGAALAKTGTCGHWRACLGACGGGSGSSGGGHTAARIVQHTGLAVPVAVRHRLQPCRYHERLHLKASTLG